MTYPFKNNSSQKINSIHKKKKIKKNKKKKKKKKKKKRRKIWPGLSCGFVNFMMATF